MAFTRESEQCIAVNRHKPLIHNKLIDKELAAELLDALGTSVAELKHTADAHCTLTAQTKEGPVISFTTNPVYMMNGADNVILVRHEDGTFSIIFYKGKKELDRISHHAKEGLEPAWWEKTYCTIQSPIFVSYFHPGTLGSMPGAAATFYKSEIRMALIRHLGCDWGEVPAEDKNRNNAALKNGGRLVSAYTYRGNKLWIITEAVGMNGKRECTTALLPDEY